MTRPALTAGFWWRTPRLPGHERRHRSHIYVRGSASSVCGYAFELPHQAPRDDDKPCTRCAEPARQRCATCGITVQQRADGTAKSHRGGRCAGIGQPTWTVKT